MIRIAVTLTLPELRLLRAAMASDAWAHRAEIDVVYVAERLRYLDGVIAQYRDAWRRAG